MSKNETRAQVIKAPIKVEVKTALPWTILVVVVAIAGGIITGWTLRSDYIVTPADVRAQVVEQLAAKK